MIESIFNGNVPTVLNLLFQNDQKPSIDSSFKLSAGRADRSDIPNLNVKQSHNRAHHSGPVPSSRVTDAKSAHLCKAGWQKSLQPCSRAARKWRENEEMKRKWRELRGNENENESRTMKRLQKKKSKLGFVDANIKIFFF